jgi:hypothetical protein
MAFRGDLGRGFLGAFELGAAFEENVSFEQSVEHTLSFVSSASAYVEHSQSVSDTLTFVSSAEGVDTHPVEDTLTFVSTADFVRTVPISVVHTLAFVSTESETGPRYRSASSNLNLQSVGDGHNPTPSVSASSILSFTSSTHRVVTEDVTSTLVFVSDGERSNIGLSTLAFVSSAVGSRGLESVLNLVSVATRNVIFRRPSDSEITIFETLSYFVEFPGLDCNYHPFVGTTTDPDAPTPPDITAPILGVALLTLTYPFVTPTNTLVLRNPDFGNTDRLEFSRIRRQSRGGTSILFSDRKWPKQQVLNLSISALSQTKAEDFLDFVTESLGQEIGLLDWENRQWRGIILNPDADITDGGMTCRYAANLQFEGELV